MGHPRVGRNQRRRQWRRALTAHRRLLVAGVVAAAVASGLHVLAPPAAVTQAVVVAAKDLPAGHALAADDVRQAAWRMGTAPSGALLHVVGRVLASPLRAGEPVTDARVTGPGLLRGQPPGLRAVTVRVGDPAAAGMLRPGDRVDVLAGQDVVVHAGLVLAAPTRGITAAGDGVAGGSSGLGGGLLGPPADTLDEAVGGLPAGVLVLAVDGAEARRLAGVNGVQLLSVALLSQG